MEKNKLVKISKYLSYHLRHHPEKLGLKLADGGWVSVKELLKAAQQDNFTLTFAELQEVVAENDKKRFSFDETGTLIKANQGHSVTVDLKLEPKIPPAILYHGTIAKNIAAITKQGLSKMSRHHVHLSVDINTAYQVGSRRGKPVIFPVDALAMFEAGYQFYLSDNGVWLVDQVPPEYLTIGQKNSINKY
jgi:putative RNA 2'-phosphotransferase